MRIIIQYYYDFLRKKTAAIDIEDEESDCSVLLKAISVKIDRQIQDFVATVKKDNISVRIIQGWPLSFYEIKEKQILNVEFKEFECQESKKQGQALNQRYLMKLGFNKMQDRNLSVIKDYEEEENDEENEAENSFGRKKSYYKQKERTSLNKKVGSQYSNSSSSDEEGGKTKNIDIKKMLEKFLEQLIQETQNNRLEEVKKLFDEVSDRLTQEQKDELQKQKLIIINKLGKGGSNPLHVAVYNQYYELSKELVERGANVNVPSNQGWTSVQIAIYKNNIKILKLLLDSQSLDLNYVSSVGTPLTVCCQFSKAQALDLVLKKNPDLSLLDQQGKSCFDYCQNEECKNILKSFKQKEAIEEQKQNELKSEIKSNQQNQQPGVFLPPKPPIVTGTLFKIGAFLFNMRERFFVINPDEGTLIRYKNKSHYPLKPLEVIPLKDINLIQTIKKSWFMSSDYTYFEINYPNRQVLACKHEQAAKKWVEYLFSACVYSLYIETRNAFNQIQMHDNTVIELQDSPNQQNILDTVGGNIKEAVKRFENQNRKDNKNKSNENANDAQSISKIQQDGKIQTNSKIAQKNTNGKPDSSNNLELPSPGSNQGPKIDIPSDSRKNDRSQSPPSQDNSTRSTTVAPEDPNVDLGSLQDEKVTFESFQILKVLGAGSFGKVFLAKKKDSGNIYAIKALKKRPLIMKRQLRYAVTEANVLKMCNHPFILGDPPYYNDDIPTMYKKIKEGNLTYPSYVSQKARNIINGLLDRNPKTRLGAQDREQLKRDPFFEGIDWEKLYNKQYKPPITEFENSDIEDDFEDASDKKIFHDFDYEQHNHNINRVKQFSFVRK
ncbi:hypothetical protein ABPG74_009207 [Tetrahymena malaccensis]